MTSPDILDELERVLMHKFGMPGREVKAYLREVIKLSDLVFPMGAIREVEDDPADDVVLETALLGGADVIVTGDRHLLRMGTYRGVDIRRAREL